MSAPATASGYRWRSRRPTRCAVRLGDLERAVICHSAPYFDWDLPGLGERFQLQSCFLSPIDRHLYANGKAEFLPVGIYEAGMLPPGLVRNCRPERQIASAARPGSDRNRAS